MTIIRRLGSALIGAAFGAWYVAFKIAGMTLHPIITRIYRTAPPRYLMIAGGVLFAIAGFNLARYLSLRGVIIIFIGFFIIEFGLPPGYDTLMKWIYLVYFAVPLLLVIFSLRFFHPANLFPFIR